MSVFSLLLQNGFYLLLEDGSSHLLLESTPDTTITGGRQVGWDEIERVERFSQAFLKDHGIPVPKFYNTNPFDPTIKARDAAVRLGRLGGIASGISRKK